MARERLKEHKKFWGSKRRDATVIALDIFIQSEMSKSKRSRNLSGSGSSYKEEVDDEDKDGAEEEKEEEKEHSEEEDAENADYEDDNGGGSAEEGDKDLQRKDAAAKAWEKNYLARASTGVTSSSTVS